MHIKFSHHIKIWTMPQMHITFSHHIKIWTMTQADLWFAKIISRVDTCIHEEAVTVTKYIFVKTP